MRPTSDVIVKKLQAIGHCFQMILPLQRMNSKGHRVVYDPGEWYSMKGCWHTIAPCVVMYYTCTPPLCHSPPTPSPTPTPPIPPFTLHPAKVKQNKRFLGIRRKAKAPRSPAGSREGTESSAASGRTPESSLGCEFIAVQSQVQDQPRGVCVCACVCVQLCVWLKGQVGVVCHHCCLQSQFTTFLCSL